MSAKEPFSLCEREDSNQCRIGVGKQKNGARSKSEVFEPGRVPFPGLKGGSGRRSLNQPAPFLSKGFKVILTLESRDSQHN